MHTGKMHNYKMFDIPLSRFQICIFAGTVF